MTRQARIIFLLVLCFLLIYSLQMWGLRRRPASDPVCDHASFRTNDWGTCAFRELLNHTGLATRTWNQAGWAELSPQVRMLWIIDPQRRPTQQDLNALTRWLQAGGSLVVAPDPRPQTRGIRWVGTTGGERLLEHLGWRIIGHEKAPPRRLRVAAGQVATRDVRQLQVSGFRLQPLPSASPRPYLAMVADDRGPVLVRQAWGKGQLFLLADADLLANRWVSGADNVVLAANLAFLSPDATVWFEEHCHMPGLAADGAPLDTTAPRRVIWALLAALALYLAGRMQRFGAVYAPPPPPRRSALETVQAFASLYQRAHRPEEVLKPMARRLRRRLERISGLDMRADPQAIVRAAKLRRPGLDADALAETLRRCAAAERGAPLTDAGLLDLARRIHRAEKELA